MTEQLKITEHKPGEPPLKRLGRYEALDGMRGIAVLLVVLFHVSWPNHITPNRFVENGYLMVDLFFILSGFVISVSHSREPVSASQVGNFLCRRLFRIYPLHLAVLAAFVGVELIKLWAWHHGSMAPSRMPFSGNNSIAMLLASIFLIHSLGLFGELGWNGPSWYMSCLFAAYVLFAVGAFSIALRNRVTFYTAIILALSGYVVLALSRQSLNITYDFGMVRCACGFFLGMAVYKLSSQYEGLLAALQSSPWLSWIEATTVAALVLVMSLAAEWQVVLVIPVFILAVVVFQSDCGLVSNLLKSRIARFLSRISYSVYMIQMFVLVVTSMVLNKVFKVPIAPGLFSNTPHLLIDPWAGDILLAVVIVLLLAIGTAAYCLIEEPARLFGKRLATRMLKPPLWHKL
jgi:peptidoglycan/LPS O-acetylase OafA/YrhL